MKENLINSLEGKILSSFPTLKKYSKNKFYCVLSPLIIGIEIIKIPRSEDYRPHFVCYPLWKNSLKSCFNNPIMLIEIKDRKKEQISLTLEDMTGNFVSIASLIKKQIPFDFGKDLKLKSLISVLDNYAKTSFLGASMNSFLQAKLAKQKVIISLLVNNLNSVQNELKLIEKKSWDLEHFLLWETKYEDWISELKEKIKNPELIKTQLRENLVNNKISKLNQFKIY